MFLIVLSWLIDLTPDLNSKHSKLKTIPGEIPQMNELSKGCPFYNRCSRCVSNCIDCKPSLEDINGHKVACFKKKKKKIFLRLWVQF